MFWKVLLVAEDRTESDDAAPGEWEGENTKKGEWNETREGRSKGRGLERDATWGSWKKGLEC